MNIIIAILCKEEFAQSDSGKNNNSNDHVVYKALDSDVPRRLDKSEILLMVKPAELNNYPDPVCVLEYTADLKLPSSQIAKLHIVRTSLYAKTRQMDIFITQREKNLNDLFATGKAEEVPIIYYTNKLGLYEAELCNVYLQAHLKQSIF